MRRYARILVYAALQCTLVGAYIFLGVSLLLLAGSSFGAAFLTSFTVQNGLDETIYVTPVGTVGPTGSRFPLPVCRNFVIPIPSSTRGGYKLQPNETITITYDMDDINFSEIVVENDSGIVGQLIANPNPLVAQYTAPSLNHFRVQTDSLVPVPTIVANAAALARQPTSRPRLMFLIIVVPLPTVLVLSWLKTKFLSILSARAEVAKQSCEPEFPIALS